MNPDRISIDLSKDAHDEPFITTADHLRERQDKSMMPWPKSEDRRRERENKDEQGRINSTRRRRRNRRSRRRGGRKTRTETEQAETKDPQVVEKEAVQKVIGQLREQGVSDEFIKENMDKIRGRVREELRKG